MKIRMNIAVKGRVQGVAFRHYTRLRARELGVAGWIANLPDGSVAGVFEGEETAVRTLVEWCRTGPPAARVEEVDVHQEACSGQFDDFDVLRP